MQKALKQSRCVCASMARSFNLSCASFNIRRAPLLSTAWLRKTPANPGSSRHCRQALSPLSWPEITAALALASSRYIRSNKHRLMRIPTPAQTSRIVWMLSIFLLFHVSRAAPIPTTSSIPRPAPAAAAAPIAPSAPNTLCYQVCSCSLFATNSQNYGRANDAFDNQLADDFYVQAGATWTVQLIYVEGRYFQGTTGPVPSVNVFFYFDSGNLPGAPVPGGTFLDVAVTDNDGTLTINLPSGVVLTEGAYWVSVQANLNLATNGRWGWDDGKFPFTFGSAYRNPGGGFGGPCTSWGRKADCIG